MTKTTYYNLYQFNNQLTETVNTVSFMYLEDLFLFRASNGMNDINSSYEIISATKLPKDIIKEMFEETQGFKELVRDTASRLDDNQLYQFSNAVNSMDYLAEEWNDNYKTIQETTGAQLFTDWFNYLKTVDSDSLTDPELWVNDLDNTDELDLPELELLENYIQYSKDFANLTR